MAEDADGGGIQDPLIQNEDIVNYLQLLNYETDFCADRGLKPLSHCFFGVPINQSEQFMYFVALTQWLLEQCGSKNSGWNQYDDPGTVTNNIVLDLKKLGIQLNYPPTKLKSGSGEAVCEVLLNLSQMALEGSRFKFRKPIIPEDEDGDDGGEEAETEGMQDLADQVFNDFSDDEDIAEMMEESIPRDAAKEEEREMIEAEIDPDEWLRECQRVAHKLKLSKNIDVKEWRAHLDQTKKYADTLKNQLPDVRMKLEKVSNDVTRTLEKITKKESMLNRGMTGMIGNYKVDSNKSTQMTKEEQGLKSSIEDLEQKYYEIEDELTKIQSTMDEVGKNISDSSPLLKIKKAIEKSKKDIKQIDIRIGVVSNTLLQCKLKERTLDGENDDDNIFMEDNDLEIN